MTDIKQQAASSWDKQMATSAFTARKAEALRSVMELTCRIMSGVKGLRLILSKTPLFQGVNSNTPAWTIDMKMCLNEPLIMAAMAQPDIDKFVRMYKGTVYHELAHVIFSPRKVGNPFMRLMDTLISKYGDQAWLDFMTLEDQRIETLYTTKWSPTTPYFTEAVAKWLLHDVSNYGGVYPLVYGRKYLPKNVREMCRVAFVNQYNEKTALALESIIDQYVVLHLPAQARDGVRLVEELITLFNRQPTGHNGLSKIECKMHKSSDLGDVADVQVAVLIEAAEAVKELIKEEKKQEEAKPKVKPKAKDKDKSDDKNEDDKNESGDGDGDGDGDGEEDGEGSSGSHTSAPSQGGGGDKSDAKAGQSSAGSGGTEAPKADEKFDAEMVKLLSDLVDDLEESLEIKTDVSQTVKSIRALAENTMLPGEDYTKFKMIPASQQLVRDSDRIVRQLKDLKTAMEPSWLRTRPEGRLNTTRAIRRRLDHNITDVFDQWDEGSEDEADCEVVIILDLSGSMGAILGQCSEALWMLKRAFDRTDIRTTVLGFSDSSVILYRPNQKINAGSVPIYGLWNGTDPTDAIKQSYNLMHKSSAANKMFIAITDGAWQGDRSTNDRVIESMNRMGVTTLLFCFGAGTLRSGGTHNCQIVMEVQRADEVLNVTKQLILTSVKRAAMARM
jgi:Mg-chelatase subunit ChlD